MADGWIGVDFDGVLAKQQEPFRSYSHGEPIMHMVERVRGWLDEGKDVRIFTGRVGVIDKSQKECDDIALSCETIRCFCERYLGKVLPITAQKDRKTRRIYDDIAVGMERDTGFRAV